MAKKLKVEVEADTAKAKRALADLANGGGAADGAATGAADRAARAMDRTARSADALSQSARDGAANLRATAKVFGGMAVRMAAGYAAQSLPEGSRERVAIDAGGAALAGALQGSVAGPIGALAGGLMGLTQALMEANSEEKARKEAIYATNAANREQLETLLAAEQRTEKFKESLKALTEIEDEAERREKIAAALEGKRGALSTNADDLTGLSSKYQGDDKAFRTAMSERGALKSEISQLEALLDRKGSSAAPDFRASMSAVDALSRIGGSFAGGDSAMRDLARTGQAQLEVLRNIEAKTGSGGGTTWQ